MPHKLRKRILLGGQSIGGHPVWLEIQKKVLHYFIYPEGGTKSKFATDQNEAKHISYDTASMNMPDDTMHIFLFFS